MAEPIRILHVIRLMNHGGVESMIMNLYRNIDRTKVQFDFVQNSNEPALYDDEIFALGGKIYHCPHYNGKNHFAYTKWWHEFFKGHSGEYAVVHGHLGSTAAIYLSIAKKYGCFAVAHSHNTGGSISFRFYSYPTRFVADHFFACSQDAARSRYGEKIAGDDDRFTMLHNAIEISKFRYCKTRRQEMRNILGIPENCLVIGHTGRFREQKNHLFLIDIFEKIYRIHSDAVLLLVGDGETRPQIEKAICGKGLQNSVILAGAQNNVNDYYQAMDAFVMPSFFEGLGIVLIEAQTSGLPCFVSTGVPAEAALTDLVQFRSLEDSAQVWAEWILSGYRIPRRDMTKAIQEAGYDIATTAKWLENYYLEVANHHG